MPGQFSQFTGHARFGPKVTATVTNKALTTNVATITTSAAHTFVTGQSVRVALSPADPVFDGTHVITSTPTGTTFTYAKTNANVTSTGAGGTAGNLPNYNAAITAVKFRFTRDRNEIPANLDTGTIDLELGARQRVIEISFLNELAATGFYEQLRSAIDLDGELYFDVQLSKAAVSASNPRRVGTAIVPEAVLGGTVGQLRSATATLRIKSGTYQKLAA